MLIHTKILTIVFQNKNNLVNIQVFSIPTSVGGVKVSIVAFQAIDPGSIPGWRKVLLLSALKWLQCFSDNACVLTFTTLLSPVFEVERHENVVFFQLEKNSTEPDLNQRPRDIWCFIQSTVSRSTNWAIGGLVLHIPLWQIWHIYKGYGIIPL